MENSNSLSQIPFAGDLWGMKKSFLYQFIAFWSLLWTVAACSVLHKTQIETVSQLCERVDTLSQFPDQVLETLSDSRRERSLYFTATLITPELRVQQLNEVVDFQIKEEKAVQKFLAYSDVLESYFRNLKSLCSPTRYEQYGVQLRGLGRQTDSLIHHYNALGMGMTIPEGYAKWSGKLLGQSAEAIARRKQGEVVRDYVQMADTLVGIYCDTLAHLLAGAPMRSWIEHEKAELAAEYEMYLQLCEPLAGRGREEDRSYLEMRRRLKDCETILRKGKSALQSLKKAHHKLALSLNRRSEIDQVYPEILEFNKLVHEIDFSLSD